MRLNLGRGAAVRDPDLWRPIAIEIDRFHLECLAAADVGLSARQMSPNFMSQMGQVEAAEYPVPVAIVTLGCENLKPGLFGLMPIRNQSAKRQTLLVGPVRFGIPDQEMLPMSSAQMRHVPIGIRAKVILQLFKPMSPAWAEGPFFHFDIGTGRQVTESGGANAIQRLAHRL